MQKTAYFYEKRYFCGVKKQMSGRRIKMAVQGSEKRRVRGLATPHAEMVIAARGDCHRRTRNFSPPHSAIFKVRASYYKIR